MENFMDIVDLMRDENLPIYGNIMADDDGVMQRIKASADMLLTHWVQDKMADISQRQHFQVHFLEWKYLNFDKYFTEVCS